MKAKAININNMINAVDKIIESLKEGFIEMTIAKIRELDKVLTSRLDEAEKRVKYMCDFVTLLVRRASLNIAKGKEILNLCKKFNDCRYVPVLGISTMAYTTNRSDPNDSSAQAKRPRRILRSIDNCTKLPETLSKLKEKFVALFGETNLIKSFDNVIEQLNECEKSEGYKSVLEKLKTLDTKYDEFSKALEAEKGDLTSTVLNYFEVIPNSLKDCLSKLK